jgi:drug/metabolite transporter (DMT)-like permease
MEDNMAFSLLSMYNIEMSIKKLPKQSWYILLIIAMICWASMFPFLKILGSELSPINIALARFLIAFIAIYPFCRISNIHFVVKKKHLFPVILLGIITSALTTVLVAWGIRYSTVIHSSLLLNSNPLFIGLFAPLLIKEKTNWKKIVGAMAGLLGIALVILNGQSIKELLRIDYLIGIGLLLGASFSQVIYTIYIKKYLKYYTGMTLTLYAMLSGTAILLIISVLSGDIVNFAKVQGLDFIWLILLGTIATVIPLIIFSSSIKRLGAITSSSFKFTIPIFATIFGILFFQEVLTVWIVSGIVLVSVGIYGIQHTKN